MPAHKNTELRLYSFAGKSQTYLVVAVSGDAAAERLINAGKMGGSANNSRLRRVWNVGNFPLIKGAIYIMPRRSLDDYFPA